MKKLLIKKVVQVLFMDGLYPLAKEFVSKTENPYDDQALDFLTDLVKDLIKKL
jgi:hypothetical protein